MQKYTRIKVLGKGGFGEAVLVEEKTTKKKYVIKEVRRGPCTPQCSRCSLAARPASLSTSTSQARSPAAAHPHCYSSHGCVM